MGWDQEDPDPTSSLSSDAFDFNYGVCVMRMREGLNVSEVMQAHSEYMPQLLGAPVKNLNSIPESSRMIFFKWWREERGTLVRNKSLKS